MPQRRPFTSRPRRRHCAFTTRAADDVILYGSLPRGEGGRVFEHRVLNVGTEVASGHAHPAKVWLRAPDGTQIVLPASVVLQMIDAGHRLVRFGSERGLVGGRAASCRACGVRVLDLEGEDTPAGPHPALTRREREIFGLLCQGLTNRQISSTLWISEGTVKAHVGNVIRKLGVSNRTQAVVVGLSPQAGTGDGPQEQELSLDRRRPSGRAPAGSPNVQPKDTRLSPSPGEAVLPLDGDDTRQRGLLRIVR